MTIRLLSLGIAGIALLAIVVLAAPAPAYYHASYAPAKVKPKALGSVVEVKGWEFAFGPKKLVVKPGAVTLRVKNVGRFPHNLIIEEVGKGTPLIPPGQVGDLSLTLNEGTHTIYCAVKGHRKQGMEGTFIVRAGR